ncbi:uncharacterized protein [Antennarius striatus]|uniref:uncharacterized protein isoform X2 n=1 Tax=Antennarius striatus TaxID=241820 RepID=UPI0035ADA303
MHQHAVQHGFTPTLHQSLTILPAALTQIQHSSFNTHLPRGTARPSFGPVHAFPRTTQKSFRPMRRLQRPNSLHPTLTPEYPVTSQHKEFQRLSCRHAHFDRSSEHSGEAAENTEHFHRCYPSSPSCCPIKKEKFDWEQPEQTPNQHRKDKITEKKEPDGQQSESENNDKPDVRVIGSFDRKRQHESESSPKVKRVKQEVVLDYSKDWHTLLFQTHLSAHSVPEQRRFTTRNREDLICYLGNKRNPYQPVSWKPLWNVHKRLEDHARHDCSVTACKSNRIPLGARSQKKSFPSFFAPPLHFPVGSTQEAVYHRGIELLAYDNYHLPHARHQLPHPNFLPHPESLGFV